MHINKIKKAVAILIRRDNKFLLLRETKDKLYERSKGRWSFPSGKVEDNEDIFSAAMRELKEETGIKKVSDFKINGLFFLEDSIDKNKHILGVSFFGELNSVRKIKSNEKMKMLWLKIKEIKKYKLRENTEILIKNYEKSKLRKR